MDRTGLLWEAWEQFMDHLKTGPKQLQPQKPVHTTKKPVFLHFIGVFHIKGVSDSI